MDDVSTVLPTAQPEPSPFSQAKRPASPWTEEKIAELTKLWREGRSAALIAQALGPDFTRMSVLGKLHRLGLSHLSKGGPASRYTRLRSTAETERKHPTVAPTPAIAARSPVDPEKRSVAGRIADSGIVMRMKAQAEPQAREAPPHCEIVDLPPEDRPDRIGILELRHSSCRWPLGEPSAPDFGYCGRTSIEGKPYCAEHHARAVARSTGRTITEEHKRAIGAAAKKRWNRARV